MHLAGAHLEAESGWSLFLRILNFMPVSSRFNEGLFPLFQSFDGAVFQSVHVKWNSPQEKQHRYRWVSCLCESNCNKADCHASWDSMPPLSSLFLFWKGVAFVSEFLSTWFCFQVECDLSCNNLLPVFNSQLLRLYAELL